MLQQIKFISNKSLELNICHGCFYLFMFCAICAGFIYIESIHQINIQLPMSTQQILNKIIKPEYRKRFDNWERYASKQDLLGLDCIAEIYASKGNKALFAKLPVEKQMYDTHQSLMKRKTKNSLEQAEDNFRLKQVTTSYQFYHAGYSAPKEPRTNIFQFKSLSSTNLARPLTQTTIAFIENWLHIHDNPKYEEAIISCLRSLSSKLLLSDPHSTEMKTSYDWKNDWNLSKPVRMDKAGEDLYAFKPNYNAIKKQQLKRQAHRQKINQLQGTEFAKQIKIFKDFKIN